MLGKNYIVALVVCEASVHGKPYSEEEKRNGSWRPEPVVPNQRAGYCRLSTADALIASPKGVLKGTLDRWKHTVVPTKDGMHIEIINRIIESNPDEVSLNLLKNDSRQMLAFLFWPCFRNRGAAGVVREKDDVVIVVECSCPTNS